MNTQPLDDLEMFELLQAAYPEKFPDDEDETFEAALNFAEELSGLDELADLLGRVVMLTMPMKSGLTERLSHCLGMASHIDKLRRGEFICQQCGLRKDGEHEGACEF
jgi:recombinational DNA repair protein (RecF pathway)